MAGLLAGWSVAPPAAAAPEEIQVYLDDMSAPGRFGVDVHNNYVISGSAVPGYPGEQPPAHVYRLTPEFYYGLSDTVELGLYVLTSAAGSDVHVDGGKLRVKYIAPHDKDEGLFWGANLELGRTPLRVSPTPWNAELRASWATGAGPGPSPSIPTWTGASRARGGR